MGPDVVNFSVREPIGVVGAHRAVQPSVHVCRRQVGGAAGGGQCRRRSSRRTRRRCRRCAWPSSSTVCCPPGVFNVVPGDRDDRCRAGVASGTSPWSRIIGSVAAGARGDARGKRDGQAAAARAGRQERADRLSPTPIRTRSRAAAVGGMNFTWCGQSCGSTSRALHSRIDLRRGARARSRRASRCFQARCLATDPATTMGAIVSACSARSRARATSKPPQRKARGLRAWRQAAFGSRARWRLLCRADACLRDVDAGDAHRARGDLRASAGDPQVVGRGSA